MCQSQKNRLALYGTSLGNPENERNGLYLWDKIGLQCTKSMSQDLNAKRNGEKRTVPR